jgi:hypothetical protein
LIPYNQTPFASITAIAQKMKQQLTRKEKSVYFTGGLR